MVKWFSLSQWFGAKVVWLVMLAFFANIAFAENGVVASQPRVKLETSMGDIVLSLDAASAPITVENFLGYVNKGFYNGLIFHRVIQGFMIQGGGHDQAMMSKSTGKSIKNESFNGLKNEAGTIAMARTGDPDSATAQFFINLVDNRSLNATPGKPGYAVFGKVIEGMDVVDAIAAVKTGQKGMHNDVPLEPVVIVAATVIDSGSVDQSESAPIAQ